ncbi:FAD-dependent oxidoreductase [Lipingzhangella sp. LS1_29]|uniref:FAD-dependent oxidoreductase n=1 Tax=Lipingzhangella rawalii TaxID=2055835 RepID=A0ABU2H832_9ACTN|nr:FAD-dependent oxidoreductase [Lipingzhangella rawalii]MDS1271142.1 FAD-dependent oxidoreductase [Lipingzhangella rawalii]
MTQKSSDDWFSTPDVIVIGAGIIGASCAYHSIRAGLSVLVLDRSGVASGTSGAGEGNILVSDKPPGAELDLALLSARRWSELADELHAEDPTTDIEFDAKGGLVVAPDERSLAALHQQADAQRSAGVTAQPLTTAEVATHEPNLTPQIAGGVRYPQDAQTQPMLATAQLLRSARRHGARIRLGTTVTGLLRGSSGRITGVRTDRGDLFAGAVVNAAGPWAGQIATLADSPLPIEPRRGFVLVTEPLPRMIRHKVYAASYVAAVASDQAALAVSPVIEGTRSGTVLIGSSRERVGFDRTVSPDVLGVLARNAISLFPFLRDVAALRTYVGFRPLCTDHLPVLGPDPRAPGLLHACGHEGAGVGLAAGTGTLIAEALTGTEPSLDMAPFHAGRFVGSQGVNREVQP